MWSVSLEPASFKYKTLLVPLKEQEKFLQIEICATMRLVVFCDSTMDNPNLGRFPTWRDDWATLNELVVLDDDNVHRPAWDPSDFFPQI